MAAPPLTAVTTTNLLLRRLLHRPLHSTTTTFSFSLLHSKPSLSLSSTLALSPSTSPQTLTLETDIHLQQQQQQQQPHFDSNGNSNSNSNSNNNGRNVTLLDENRKVPDSLGDKLKSQQIANNGNGNVNSNGNSTNNGNGRDVTVLDEKRKVLEITVKEKKEICSYANSLGEKLKSQQIGKSGVTDNVAFALSETLEKNELLKLKIHKSCPGEWEDIVKQVEQATGSIVVGQIGRTIILYRPSVSKLKADEKRELHRKIFAQRKHKAKIAFMNQRKDQNSRPPRRGRNRRLEKIES